MQQQLGFVNNLRICLKTEDIQGELRRTSMYELLANISENKRCQFPKV